MLIMIAAFVAGVVMYSVLPEGTVRVMGMALYSAAVYWSIFKYAL